MIHFETIRWKNFLSTGNIFTEINLSSEMMTLIIGSNGSGKSTLLDAICFALFGKPFRNINKPQLLNAINQKDCLVEVEFSIGAKAYKVVRGIKPNVFEVYCNNQLLTQTASVKDYQEQLEKLILKLNYKSFTQIVILGSASFTPFMQLSANDRRMIIEDLLDIQIFSRMNGVLKERYAKLKEDITTLKHNSDLMKSQYEIIQSHVEVMKKDKRDRIKQKTSLIDKENSTIVNLNIKADALSAEIEELKLKSDEADKLESKLQKYDLHEKNLTKTLTKVKKDIEMYETTDECPTCKQNIPHEHKHSMIGERSAKLGEVETALDDLTTKYNDTVEQLETMNKLLRSLTTKTTEYMNLTKSITASSKYVASLTEEVDEMKAENTNVKDEEAKLAQLSKMLGDAESKIEELTMERTYYDVATTLLKDTGIKTKIIKQYIPIINRLVNKYLSAMDFFVNFNLDESFTETIKSRHRDEFSYASFSEGEKQRIDMALMLTWRAVAKLKNSSNTNLLILDEIFDSSLDANGTEDLMKILDLLEHTNLFIISHKGDILQDKFRNVIKFEKVNNFSRITP